MKIRVINGQFKDYLGKVLTEVHKDIYLVQFNDRTTGIVTKKNLRVVGN
ncbi:MAG: hypothetical protein E7G01_10430 [Enterococcus faecalis]|nr:hypothetical protein [Enterococcus faecalis]